MTKRLRDAIEKLRANTLELSSGIYTAGSPILEMLQENEELLAAFDEQAKDERERIMRGADTIESIPDGVKRTWTHKIK